jgi:hypothetical protein
MDYKITLNGTTHLINISSAYFKSWHVWNIKFNDGKVVMLFKMGSEWLQRNDDFLEAPALIAIGNAIDKIIFRRKAIAF